MSLSGQDSESGMMHGKMFIMEDARFETNCHISFTPASYLNYFIIGGLTMSFQMISMATLNRLTIKNFIATVIGVCFMTSAAIGADHKLSDEHEIYVEPAAKQKLGEKTFGELMEFFHEAEKAIETKDLNALMDLYSENYADGEHNKKSAEVIWERIFATFETTATRHNMRLVKMAEDKNMVIFRCSGLLLGVPNPSAKMRQKGLVTIDNWAQQDHVLVKEAGKWKLIGTYGTERKRLWFDKPMHPLF